MHIYFIRHGETEYNRRGIHQYEDVPLSGVGKAQIEQTAKALQKLPITKLISSNLYRAKESAAIVAKEIGLPVELSELFREVKRPSNLYGHRHFSLVTLTTGISVLYHFFDPAWHFKDEENFYDVRARIEKAVASLQQLKGEHEHIAIVSHAFIINMFVKYMCAYKRVRRRDYLRAFIAAKLFKNASITTVAYSDDANPNTCDWVCLSINNTEHLR